MNEYDNFSKLYKVSTVKYNKLPQQLQIQKREGREHTPTHPHTYGNPEKFRVDQEVEQRVWLRRRRRQGGWILSPCQRGVGGQGPIKTCSPSSDGSTIFFFFFFFFFGQFSSFRFIFLYVFFRVRMRFVFFYSVGMRFVFFFRVRMRFARPGSFHLPSPRHCESTLRNTNEEEIGEQRGSGELCSVPSEPPLLNFTTLDTPQWTFREGVWGWAWCWLSFPTRLMFGLLSHTWSIPWP